MKVQFTENDAMLPELRNMQTLLGRKDLVETADCLTPIAQGETMYDFKTLFKLDTDLTYH